eukprot:PhF_6_TR23820/c0_g1_i3/m.33369
MKKSRTEDQIRSKGLATRMVTRRKSIRTDSVMVIHIQTDSETELITHPKEPIQTDSETGIQFQTDSETGFQFQTDSETELITHPKEPIQTDSETGILMDLEVVTKSP